MVAITRSYLAAMPVQTISDATYQWYYSQLFALLDFLGTLWSFMSYYGKNCRTVFYDLSAFFMAPLIFDMLSSYSFSKMKTVTNRKKSWAKTFERRFSLALFTGYILNLAIADECFLIGVPILIYTMHLGEWIFGDHMCRLYMISTSITQFTSSIFLVIMSADRWVRKWIF